MTACENRLAIAVNLLVRGKEPFEDECAYERWYAEVHAFVSGATASAELPAAPFDKLSELTLCAHAWEPSVCLLGNVTARDLRLLCAELAQLRHQVAALGAVRDAATRWINSNRDAEAARFCMDRVRDIVCNKGTLPQ